MLFWCTQTFAVAILLALSITSLLVLADDLKGQRHMAEVVTLHGVEPPEIFKSGLDNVSEIQAAAISILWKDGRVTAGWSNMDPAALARLVLILDERQRRATIHDQDLHL